MNVVSIATSPEFKPSPDPVIEYTWIDERGLRRKNERLWKLPETPGAIAAWMGRYFERVAAGYIPEGYTVAPRPTLARIKVGRRVVAKWKLEDGIPESVGFRVNLKNGGAGIPVATARNG